MSMMVVVHRSVNETKTEHADNEYVCLPLISIYKYLFNVFIVQVAKAGVAEN